MISFRLERPPNPEEFIQYILNLADSVGIQNLNKHIRPMWTMCPFCSIQFDVIGHLEEMDEDVTFILSTMNLTVINAENN